MFDRCRCHAIAYRVGEPLEAFGTVLADPGDGCGDQMHAKQVGHQRCQTFFRQQLVVQQIQHKGRNPLAVLHRCGDAFGKRRARLRAAGRAKATVRTVFRDNQRLWFGEIEHLPGDVAGRHRRSQRLAARGANLRIMVDGGVGCRSPAQRLAWVALLSTGPLAGPLPQIADPWRLLQPVAGRRLAAVAAVQPKLALQFGDARLQRSYHRL
jgi:hypothetical protein